MSGTKVSSELYRALQGVFCVYKPSNMSTRTLTASLKLRISNELNKLPLNTQQSEVIKQHKLTACGNLITYDHRKSRLGRQSNRHSKSVNAKVVTTRDDTETSLSLVDEEHQLGELTKELSPLKMDARDVQFHPAVLGGLWRSEDIAIKPLDNISTLTSGVLPYAFGKYGKRDLKVVEDHNPVKVYRVTAQLGVATDNFLVSGGIIEKVDHKHVTQPLIDRVLSAIQASHLKQQYILAGVELQSQEAYELASRGLVRPPFRKHGTNCTLFSIKSVEWNPPELVMEIHIVNETGPYIVKLIHDVGQDLRCGAACTKIRRIRVGHFDITHSLVRSQWNCDEILTNMDMCREPLGISMVDRLEQMAAQDESKLIASSKVQP